MTCQHQSEGSTTTATTLENPSEGKGAALVFITSRLQLQWTGTSSTHMPLLVAAPCTLMPQHSASQHACVRIQSILRHITAS